MARLPRLKSGRGGLSWRRVFLLVTLLLLAWGGYSAWRVWGTARSLLERLDRLQTAAEGDADLTLRDVVEDLRGAHADLAALKDQVALFMPLTRFMGWLPGVGGDLRAAPALLDTALAVTDAGVLALDGLEPLLDLTEGDSTQSQPLAFMLQTLSAARPDLQAAQERLAAAQARRAEIDERDLSARTAALLARLDRYLPLMQTALNTGRLLPDLLGAAGQRTFLILAQNNDELRATGGFISAAGTLVLDGGEIAEISFQDTYTLDDFSHPYPDPPEPYLRYMGLELWVFRDANWSPDFPTSAQTAVELYHISRDLNPDGVLAVDQEALRAIVAALEPLEVQDWPEAVTADNVISLIRLAWSPDETENWQGWDVKWWRQRKSFMGDLVGAMQAKVETSPDQVNWLVMARAVLRTLQERHLQIWLADSSGPAAHLLTEQGWDGALRRASSDYLMVVDTNMGFNKVNALIQPSLDYRVLVYADGNAQATLTVAHRNPGAGTAPCDHQPRYGANYEDLTNRCYWNYMRVYAPPGSRLYAATPHPVAPELLVSGQRQTGVAEALPEEHDKAVFASFFVLPRGQETQTRFVYQLPSQTLEPPAADAAVPTWRYRLLVQKQPGTRANPLRVTLALPPGASVQKAGLLEGARDKLTVRQPEPGTVTFDVTLDRDCMFEVSFQMNKN